MSSEPQSPPSRWPALAAFAIAAVLFALLASIPPLWLRAVKAERQIQSATPTSKPWEVRVWEGYFHAACNYRFYLRKAERYPERAKEFTDWAHQWRQLEARWQIARDQMDGFSSQGYWEAEEKYGRLQELQSRQADIEAREPSDAVDAELMSEVQEKFEKFIGYDRKTGKYRERVSGGR